MSDETHVNDPGSSSSSSPKGASATLAKPHHLSAEEREEERELEYDAADTYSPSRERPAPVKQKSSALTTATYRTAAERPEQLDEKQAAAGAEGHGEHTGERRDQVGETLAPIFSRSKSQHRSASWLQRVRSAGGGSLRGLEEGRSPPIMEGSSAAVRTFSRSRTLADDPTEGPHLFGGDVGRRDQELNLERLEKEASEEYIVVHWEGDDDPENPRNFSNLYKWYATILSGLFVLNR